MADLKSWLRAVLKRKSFNESLVEVLALEEGSSVVGKGENYLSKIDRVKATVLLGSGKTKQISLIVKNQHETEHMKKLSMDLGVFFREITMYRDILPKMEDLLDEINDSEGIIWGRCYDYRLYDRIVLEDLGVSGYKMADRKKQLGLESALLVIKGLAKFHALTKILLQRGEIPLEIFQKHIWSRNPELTIKMTTENAERLIKVMKTWGDEWQEPTERFERMVPDLGKLFIEALDTKPEEFSVLSHGDCWTNNMLFKGDLENPTSMKFVDLQISSVATPARDLSYFFMTSVRLEVRKQHNDQILQAYIDSLKYHLLKFEYEGFIPDMDALKEDLKKKNVYNLDYAGSILAIITGDTQNLPDIEEIVKAADAERNNGQTVDEMMVQSNTYTITTKTIIMDILTSAMESGMI